MHTQRQNVHINSIAENTNTNLITLPRMTGLQHTFPQQPTDNRYVTGPVCGLIFYSDALVWGFDGNSKKANGLPQGRQHTILLQALSGAPQMPKTTVIIPTTASQMTTQLLVIFGLPKSSASIPTTTTSGKKYLLRRPLYPLHPLRTNLQPFSHTRSL